MATRGNNFFYYAIPGLALAPQSVTTATVNGPDIVEPWRLGRQISFFLLGGAIAATVTGISANLFGKQRSDGTYVNLKAHDGTTNLGFTASRIADAGDLETSGYLLGTVPFDELSGLEDAYSAIRLTYVAGGTGAALIGCGYLITSLFSKPFAAADDDLWSKLR